MESNTNINNPFLGFVNPSESDNMYPVNVPHALPESLLDDFTRMNLSGYSHQAQDNNVHGGMGSFLGINSNNNYGRHVVDSPRMVLDSQTDMQRMSVFRAQAQAQAQMQRQLLYLQGSGNVNCVANPGFVYNGMPNVMTNGFEAPAIRLNRTNDYGGYLAPNANVYLRDIGRVNVDNLFVYDYLMNNGNGIVSANNNVNNVNNVVSTNNNFRNHRASTVQREHTLGYSSVEEVRGSIYKLTKDQAGCKFLGEKIEKGKPEDIEMIFVEIKDHVRALMVDQIGNFVMQKFFEFCNQEQMNAVLMSVINDNRSLLSLCLDMHGYASLQTILHCVNYFLLLLILC